MEKPILALRNIQVDFVVRGKTLTAIRDVSLDLYKSRVLAIVGESGSGKSVLTKTFTGMLEENGRLTKGRVWFQNDELVSRLSSNDYSLLRQYLKDKKNLPLELKRINRRKNEIKTEITIEYYEKKLLEFDRKIVEKTDVLNKNNEATRVNNYQKEIDDLKSQKEEFILAYKNKVLDTELETIEKRIKEITLLIPQVEQKIISLKKEIKKNEIEEKESKKILKKEATLKYNEEVKELNNTYTKEKIASLLKEENDDYNAKLLKLGDKPNKDDLDTLKERHLDNVDGIKGIKKDKLFAIKVEYKNKTAGKLNIGKKKLVDLKLIDNYPEYKNELTNVEVDEFKEFVPLHDFTSNKDWLNIRGKRIATIFQDPMTSLNPLRRIGSQITEVLEIHHNLSKREAKKEAIKLLNKVGIPNADKRFRDFPFQYSGGMRQRVVIAIALACRPQILICDEPTTALDVTIQAQIINLIKELQKEYGFATIYITHDLGVVANVADDVAVMYAGQIVEIGTVEEMFYESKHPYTWALLSSLPQLGIKGEELFSIPGTPPSLYTKIKGDAFAPRNPYALAIDYEEEPPFFEISETHKAKSWLLDKRAPAVTPPASVVNIRESLANIKKELTRITGGNDEQR